MPTNSFDDRWLLPRRQTEVPTWDLLSEGTLHGRREATYLVLAATFVVSLAALIALGTTRVIDPGQVLAALVPGVELPIAMVIPLGAIPFALAFAALTLACELFGRRRASALVWVGTLASAGLVGLLRLGDVVGGGDALGVGLALAACSLVATAGYLMIFDALRRRTRGYWLWPRLFGAALLPLALGWGAFGLALHGYGEHLGTAPSIAEITALAIGGGAYTLVALIAVSVPVVIAVRALALYLRVGRIETDDLDDIEVIDRAAPREPAALGPLAQGSVARPLPHAVVVDDDAVDEPVEMPRNRRAQRASLQPYSSAELKFFTEGDQLGTAD